MRAGGDYNILVCCKSYRQSISKEIKRVRKKTHILPEAFSVNPHCSQGMTSAPAEGKSSNVPQSGQNRRAPSTGKKLDT